jgi:hypothetical protein
VSRSPTKPKDMPQEMWEPDIHSPNGKSTSAENGNAPAVGQLLSEVKAERVSWFWRARIPRGKLTVMDGDPGLGKSALTADLAARKSAGLPLPDGEECDSGGVVICSAEDGLSDTIRPRLDAAGGDPSKVLALATVADGQGERLISIPEDLHIIERGIKRVRAELVIVDPLMAFLSGDTNSHRDQDVRRALAPLAKMAEGTGAAVLVVRHLNKATGGNAIYRGGGSIGIVGAARSALLVAKHPDDEQRRVLAPLKNNLAAPASSLSFSLSEAANGAVQVEWEGESHLSAAALLMPPRDEEERSARSDASDFLHKVLADGPLLVATVKEQAKDAGISWRSIERAKPTLGVKSKKQGMDAPWVWALPDEGDEDRQTSEDGGLREQRYGIEH